MIIARDVKIVPRAAGAWDNTSSANEQKNEKKTTINNSSVLCVMCEKCNEHSLFARS
jgi:hypothetical protein